MDIAISAAKCCQIITAISHSPPSDKKRISLHATGIDALDHAAAAQILELCGVSHNSKIHRTYAALRMQLDNGKWHLFFEDSNEEIYKDHMHWASGTASPGSLRLSHLPASSPKLLWVHGLHTLVVRPKRNETISTEEWRSFFYSHPTITFLDFQGSNPTNFLSTFAVINPLSIGTNHSPQDKYDAAVVLPSLRKLVFRGTSVSEVEGDWRDVDLKALVDILRRRIGDILINEIYFLTMEGFTGSMFNYLDDFTARSGGQTTIRWDENPSSWSGNRDR